MSVEEFLKIKEDSIIITDTAVDDPILVTITGIPKVKGKMGVYKGNKAVRVEEVIS
jgi:flagellar motor switch protein FliM